MSAYKKILVAVKNPDARSQPGVNKAIGIARSLGASVELFHSITTPVFLELEPLTGKTVAEIKREALQLRRKRLEKLDRKSTRLNSSHSQISYAVFCLKKKKVPGCSIYA